MGRIYKEFYCRAKRKGCNQWVEGKFAPYPATDGKFYLSAVPVGPVYEIDLDTVEYLYEIPESPPAMAEKEVKLIDANALIEEVLNSFVKSDWRRDSLIKHIQFAPTIDPESLCPHGKWERVSGDMHSSGYAVRCTNCGKYHFVHYRDSLGGLYGHDELFREPPDCPNCGAKMEG